MKIVETRVLPKKFGELCIGDVFTTQMSEEYTTKSIYMKIPGGDTNNNYTAVCLSEPGSGTLELVAANIVVYPYPDATLVLNKFVEE